ncbi:MAG: HAD-IB family hydrolase [Agriterribacter sp.]
MNKGIAFFDFDGTVTYKDTLLEIIKFQKGPLRYYLGMLRLSPWLVAMKLKLVTNSFAKQRLLTLFFGGMSQEAFQQQCDAFVHQKLPSLLRPGALDQIKAYQLKNIPVVIVSASPENWIAVWCEANNIQCIATKLEVKDKIITGRIDGNNCHGKEKVARIKALYDLSAYNEIFCYGDTKGDKPMLGLATSAYYKPFR